MNNQAYLSLGSNIDPETNFFKAVELLSNCGRVLVVSTVWESVPLGTISQPNYLNAVVLLETDLEASVLKERCLVAVENELGRIRSGDPYGPRTMDIDVLLFNHDILAIEHRSIPNPEILERAFVAIPLAEIAPDYVHPETGQTLSQIAETFGDVREIMVPREDIKLTPGNEPGHPVV